MRDCGRGRIVLRVEEGDCELRADQPAHSVQPECFHPELDQAAQAAVTAGAHVPHSDRSEEHTSELQSLAYLVCRLLLEKKKTKDYIRNISNRKAKKKITIQ